MYVVGGSYHRQQVLVEDHTNDVYLYKEDLETIEHYRRVKLCRMIGTGESQRNEYINVLVHVSVSDLDVADRALEIFDAAT